MGLLWIEGFDHYGDDEDLLEQGPYAEVNLSTLSTEAPRTGSRALKIGAGNDGGFRRVFGADLSEVGIGYAFLIPELPSNSQSMALAQIRDNANNELMTLGVTSTGQVQAWAGPNRLVASPPGEIRGTSAPVVLAGSYQHFEAHIGADFVEVRLNGVTVLNLTGVAWFAGAFAQVQVGSPGLAVTGFPLYMMVDDLYAWDTTSGTQNTDFVGDKKVWTVFPDADTATEEWTPATGANSWAMLDDVPPQDGTHYLAADAAGTRSDFEIDDVPETIVAIAGVMLATRAWKTDAGNAKVQVGMISDGDEERGAEHALSQAPTYYHDVFELDPATATLWTVEGVNAAQSLLERTE